MTTLGLAGLGATEATLSAATVAILGLALIGLGVLIRQVGREQVAGALLVKVARGPEMDRSETVTLFTSPCRP